MKILQEVKLSDSFARATYNRIRASARVDPFVALRRALLSKAHRMVAVGLEIQGDILGEWSVRSVGDDDVLVQFCSDHTSEEAARALVRRVLDAVE